MSDATSPRSALASIPRFGGASAALALRELPGSTILHLEGTRPSTKLDAVFAALGLAEPLAIGMSGGRDGARLLCIGPAIWLLVLDQSVVIPAALTLAGAVGQAFEAALDASHAHTGIEIGGSKATDFIAKGCALDLHPQKFPPGACAATGFAGMRTILWRASDGDRFALFVGRSYAISISQWLADAAAEYNEIPAMGVRDQ